MKNWLRNQKIIFGIVIVAAFIAVGLFLKSRSPEPVSPVVNTPAPQPLPPPMVPPPPIYPTQSGKPPQFVVLSFDGSYSLDMWQQTLEFSESMGQQGHSINFTYFLSGVYFLNYRKSVRYEPPIKPAGTSLIGFGASNLDIEARVGYVNRAISEGHEIASHANGHFDGSAWTLPNWQQELSQFNKLIFHIPENNDVSAIDVTRYQLNLNSADMVGFRAPNLGRNNNMFQALLDNGYQYDTSMTGKATDWPKKLENGLWEFPLASINYANTNSTLLAMDYNFYYKQSKAKDVTRKGELLWNQFYKDTYTSYMNYFEKNYGGNRAPVYIGSHFSNWNDGVYWEAMRDFGSEVCTKPEVYCITFRELMRYLDQNTPTSQQK